MLNLQTPSLTFTNISYKVIMLLFKIEIWIDQFQNKKKKSKHTIKQAPAKFEVNNPLCNFTNLPS